MIPLFFTFTCVAQQPIAKEIKAKLLRIETTYAQYMTPEMIGMVDSAINATVFRYNGENRSYRAVLDTGSADAVLQISFSKARLITHRQRKTAYIYDAATTSLGLIYMISGWGTPFVISVLPNHRVRSRLTLTINSSGAKPKRKNLNVRTEVLLANSNKQAAKLLHKFSDKLYTELNAIESSAGLSLNTTAN